MRGVRIPWKSSEGYQLLTGSGDTRQNEHFEMLNFLILKPPFQINFFLIFEARLLVKKIQSVLVGNCVFVCVEKYGYVRPPV